MSDSVEDSWKEWLLEVVWKRQKQNELTPDHLMSSKKLHDSLLCELARQKAQPAVELSAQVHSRLEESSICYVTAALTGAGWKFEPGKRFSTSEMASELGVVDQHLRLLGRLLEMLCEEGFLRRAGEEWEVVVEPAVPDVEEYERTLSSPEMEAESAMFRHCAPELAQVLRGECLPLELLFPDGDTTLSATFYNHSAVPRMMNCLIGEVVRSELARFPADRNFRILEVGAGTGSTTSRILPILADRRTEFVFTDISRYFFRRARERFQECSPLSYRILDIEQDPIAQGFEPGSYDLVVAANVLHATKDLRVSLDHVRRLLRPEGMLVLLEITGSPRWPDLVFGLTTGWWSFADRELRPSHPLLPLTRWEQLLKESGFDEVVAVSSNDNPGQASGSSGPGLLPLSVITARKKTTCDKEVPQQKRWLIFADTLGIGERLKDRLCARGDECFLVFPGEAYEKASLREYRIDLAEPQHYKQLLDSLAGPLHGIVHLWSLDSPSLPSADDLQSLDSGCALDTTLSLSCRSTLNLIQAVYDVCLDSPALWLVTRGARHVRPECAVPAPAQSALWGMGRVIGLEHPELSCALIDLDPDIADSLQASNELLSEITSGKADEDQVAFRNGERYVARLSPLRPASVEEPQSGSAYRCTFRADAGYMITGGLGGLGLLVSRWMVDRGARCLILTSRTRPGPERIEQVKELERAGARVLVVQSDVSDAVQVGKLLDEIEKGLPPLQGIVHAAGVLDDGILLNMNWERFKRVLDPKVKGAWNLHTATVLRKMTLDFFVLFSSAVSMLGNGGQANYTAANTFLDALAYNRRAKGLAGLSINWGAWYELGALAENKTSGKMLKKLGMDSIDPRNGLTSLDFLLDRSFVQAGVIPLNWPKFIEYRRLESVPFFSEFIHRAAIEEH